MNMLADVFDELEMGEMAATFAGASLVELEQMTRHLLEVKRMIYREIASRSGRVVGRSAPVDVVTSPKPKSGSVMRSCDNKGCGVVYPARRADLARGWAKCCSKSCAASHKLRGNPSHGYRHGGSCSGVLSEHDQRERMHQEAMAGCELGRDGHKDVF
jgi:hypothetical protein